VNLGNRRHEKCPACKKWHRTREYKGPLEDEDGKALPIYGYDKKDASDPAR
jgi:hypothetical protein